VSGARYCYDFMKLWNVVKVLHHEFLAERLRFGIKEIFDFIFIYMYLLWYLMYLIIILLLFIFSDLKCDHTAYTLA